MQTMTIPRRFRGPPNSGNGGYVCGMLARQIAGAAEVTLRARLRPWRRSLTSSRSEQVMGAALGHGDISDRASDHARHQSAGTGDLRRGSRVPLSEVVYATGHSVWGILNGPATGEALAELIAEGVSSRIDLVPSIRCGSNYCANNAVVGGWRSRRRR